MCASTPKDISTGFERRGGSRTALRGRRTFYDVEILTSLGELPVRGAYFIFMPIKITGSSGEPDRAMALLPE